jgi:toxin CcdB
MAQLDVFRNANPATRSFAPYLVDLQHELLSPMKTRVVAPLLHADRVRPISRLNPTFEIEGNPVVMSTQELAGVPQTAFGERVGSVADRRDEIIGALDLLFMGI